MTKDEAARTPDSTTPDEDGARRRSGLVRRYGEYAPEGMELAAPGG